MQIRKGRHWQRLGSGYVGSCNDFVYRYDIYLQDEFFTVKYGPELSEMVSLHPSALAELTLQELQTTEFMAPFALATDLIYKDHQLRCVYMSDALKQFVAELKGEKKEAYQSQGFAPGWPLLPGWRPKIYDC